MGSVHLCGTAVGHFPHACTEGGRPHIVAAAPGQAPVSARSHRDSPSCRWSAVAVGGGTRTGGVEPPGHHPALITLLSSLIRYRLHALLALGAPEVVGPDAASGPLHEDQVTSDSDNTTAATQRRSDTRGTSTHCADECCECPVTSSCLRRFAISMRRASLDRALGGIQAIEEAR